MNYLNLFRIAVRALIRNKLRAILTMLGIVIGVASVIAMLAIGEGSKQSITDRDVVFGHQYDNYCARFPRRARSKYWRIGFNGP